MSSSVSFSFNPALIPADLQPAFMARFFQLVTEYQIVSSATTTPSSVAPSADTLPHPTAFVAVDGDDTSVPAPEKKPRKNAWAYLTDEQRAERLAAMKRGRENRAAERKMSTDFLVTPVPAPVDAVVDAAVDSGSETSSKRKPRGPLTEEQRAARNAKRAATLAAKKAAAI